MLLISATATTTRLVKSSQTNSRGLDSRNLETNATYHEMCLFYADFKRFRGLQGRYFGPPPQHLVNHPRQRLVNHEN